MKKLAVLLAALSVAAPALADDSKLAPAVARTPAKAPAPKAGQSASPRDFQAALAAAAAQDGGDPLLDAGLVRTMSQLLAAGRCGEATSLANRDRRKELAARAQQLCR